MRQKYTLPFFAGRIKEIGNALMHDLGNYDEKIPSDIITVVNADEEGRLWFYIKRPPYIAGTSISFPVSLQFLRKGKNFFLKITGVARSANNNYSTVSNPDYTVNYSGSSNLTLMEMKINSIEYAEYDSTKKENGLRSWIRILCSQLSITADHTNSHSAKIILN